ncbi:MAG: RND transporter, partial [Micrococcales bacterium]
MALWCADRPWRVVAVSMIVLAAAVAGFAQLGITTMSHSERLVGDSAEAQDLIDGVAWDNPPTEHVIVTVPGGSISQVQIQQLGAELTQAYAGVQGVSQVGQPVPGADGASLVLPVELAADTDDASPLPEPEDVVEPMLAATDRFATDHPDLTVGQVGPGATGVGMSESFDADFHHAELISLPVTLLVLLVAFGALVAAGVPLLLGVWSVAVAFGLTAAASMWLLPVDENAQSLILLIGLAVGVDYALFYVRRTREERANGASNRDAIAIAGATAGRAITISGLTVVVAMSGMLVAGGLFTSLALGAVLVVAVAVIATATLLPAVLSLLGDKVTALRLPLIGKRSGTGSSAWGALARAVSRRPLVWASGVAAVLLAASLPAAGMKTALGGLETFPQDLPMVQAYHQLKAAAPTDGTVVEVVVGADPESAGKVAQAFADVASDASAMPHITGVAAEPRVSLDGSVSVLALGTDLEPSSEELPSVVRDVREQLVPDLRLRLSDAENVRVHLAGEADVVDLAQWMRDRLPWVVGFVLAVTLVVMLVSFGSPWLAAASVGLNLLSVGAAYGIMTMVFSGTWAEGLLDFTSTGSIAAWLPMLMFVVLFGLSMDYHVFVTSRVREAWLAGADAREAVHLGVARSAGVVTSAAAVMVAVFGIFGTMSM